MIFGDLWSPNHHKIDFHVAAESSMFFLFPRAFAFDFDFALPPCASLPSALVWGCLVAPVHVEVPLPGGCCHLQSDLGETASSRWIGRFSAVTRTRLQLDLYLLVELHNFCCETIQRFVNLPSHPQAMQQNRQLSGHRNHGSPLAILATS